MSGKCAGDTGSGDAGRLCGQDSRGGRSGVSLPCQVGDDALSKLKRLGYDPGELTCLPESVVRGSAGCGNPLAAADPKPGETVVDLGCGVGMDCFLAAMRVGPTGKVIGIDKRCDVLEAAEANRRKLGLDNVEFRFGHLSDLPVDSETVDVAFSNCVGPVIHALESVLDEAFRVLKPGGRLVVAGGLAVDSDEHAVDDDGGPNVPGPLTEAEYIQRLRRAGFCCAEVVSKTVIRGRRAARAIIRAFKPLK